MSTLTCHMKDASSGGRWDVLPMEKVIGEKKQAVCLEAAFSLS